MSWISFILYWHKDFPHVRTRPHKTQQNFIQFFKKLVDERVSTQKDDSGMVYLDFETPRIVYEQYVHGNAGRVLSYQEFLDTLKSSFPRVMTLAEKCPRIDRNITQFISKAIEDNAKCLGKQKSKASLYRQLYKQYVSSQHFDFHVTKSYFYEMLNTQWHDSLPDAIVQFYRSFLGIVDKNRKKMAKELCIFCLHQKRMFTYGILIPMTRNCMHRI